MFVKTYNLFFFVLTKNIKKNIINESLYCRIKIKFKRNAVGDIRQTRKDDLIYEQSVQFFGRAFHVARSGVAKGGGANDEL